MMDFNSAYSKMNAFLDAGGMSDKVAMFNIFPVAGQTSDYDFATMMVLRDDDAMGELATLMSTGGAAMQSSLFEPLQECTQNSLMLSSPFRETQIGTNKNLYLKKELSELLFLF